MAGSVAVSRSSKDIDGIRKKEVLITLTCISDSSDGSIPDTDLAAMDEYVLTEEQNKNPAASYPTTAYRVKVVDDEDGTLLLTTDRSVVASAKEFTGGHETLGYYPRIDGTITVKHRNSADDDVANVGNSKTFTVKLRFEKK